MRLLPDHGSARRAVLLKEWLRRKAQKDVTKALRDQLIEKQKDFIDSTARSKVACCSRRAGKTWMLVRGILLMAHSRPDSDIAIVTDTREHIKKLVWDEMLDIAEELSIPLRANHNDLILRFPNKSRVWLAGIPTIKDAKKLKGFRFDLAVIDECQDVREEILAYTLDEVFAPALMDTKGQLWMTGTPGARKHGRWFEASSGASPGWSLWSWNQVDNPRFPAWAHIAAAGEDWQKFARGYVQVEILGKGFSLDDPKVRREWFGEWIEDLSKAIFKVPDGAIVSLEEKWNWDAARLVASIDLGFTEEAAFVVNALLDGKIRQVYEHAQTRMSLSDIIEHAKSIYLKFPAPGCTPANVKTRIEMTVVDPSGGGANMNREIQQRFHLPSSATEKTNKRDYLILGNDAFGRGVVKVLPKTAQQLRSLEWDEERKKEHDSGQPQGLADAWLYSWRYLSLFAEKTQKPMIPSEDELMLARRLRQIRKKNY